jgi:pyruvate formate lyase activating enzyme
MRELYQHVDAANIDLKSMSEAFYRDVCDATLKPVLHCLATAKSMAVLVEVTNLLIPTLNDADRDIQSLCRWVKENMGWETPLHFSRFFPQYRMRHLPPTPADTLLRARDIARAEGLKHVYVGNVLVAGGGDTCCASCGKTLIRRSGYTILDNSLRDGRCPDCGTEVYGVWQ